MSWGAKAGKHVVLGRPCGLLCARREQGSRRRPPRRDAAWRCRSRERSCSGLMSRKMADDGDHDDEQGVAFHARSHRTGWASRASTRAAVGGPAGLDLDRLGELLGAEEHLRVLRPRVRPGVLRVLRGELAAEGVDRSRRTCASIQRASSSSIAAMDFTPLRYSAVTTCTAEAPARIIFATSVPVMIPVLAHTSALTFPCSRPAKRSGSRLSAWRAEVERLGHGLRVRVDVGLEEAVEEHEPVHALRGRAC